VGGARRAVCGAAAGCAVERGGAVGVDRTARLARGATGVALVALARRRDDGGARAGAVAARGGGDGSVRAARGATRDRAADELLARVARRAVARGGSAGIFGWRSRTSAVDRRASDRRARAGGGGDVARFAEPRARAVAADAVGAVSAHALGVRGARRG